MNHSIITTFILKFLMPKGIRKGTFRNGIFCSEQCTEVPYWKIIKHSVYVRCVQILKCSTMRLSCTLYILCSRNCTLHSRIQRLEATVEYKWRAVKIDMDILEDVINCRWWITSSVCKMKWFYIQYYSKWAFCKIKFSKIALYKFDCRGGTRSAEEHVDILKRIPYHAYLLLRYDIIANHNWSRWELSWHQNMNFPIYFLSLSVTVKF